MGRYTLCYVAANPLDEHQARLEQWASQLLDPYIKRLKRHNPPYETFKELNDPVWGTLQLHPHEVVVLDSPLLQRLRRIRQLGVVHFVYPAATHSRLEHSLGVVHQVQRLVTSINEHGFPAAGEGRRDAPLSEPQERILRLAALCHDIGHGAMSHVSEYSVEEERDCVDIRLAFQKEHEQSATNQLSEIAAYYVLGSPAFAAMMEQVHRLCTPPSWIDNLPQKLQKIVIGKSIDMDVLLLHELVSGPFDADKLDYIARDALMCGVPNVADIPRLIQKARAVRVDRSRLPKKLKRLAPDRPDGYLVVTGIARSGANTLEEITLARTQMFDKIYRHQKVRGAEAVVFSLMAQLKKISQIHPSMLPFYATDDEFIGLTEETIAKFANISLESANEEVRNAVCAAAYLAQRLRDRRLFVRGFAYAAVMPRDDFRHDPMHKQGLERFVADTHKPEERTRITARIVELVEEICTHIDNPDLVKVPGGDLSAYIWISPPKPPPKTMSAGTGHAYLIDENGALLQADENTSEVSGWRAYVATRDLGFIFTLRRLAPIVYLATEAFIRQEYSVRIPEAMLAYAKQNRSAIDKYKRKLEEVGWYDDRPIDIRPMPAVLTKGDTVDRADEIVEKLAGYSGPWQAPVAGQTKPTSTIGRQHVLSFVRQFGEDKLVDAALTVLSHIKVIGRPEANEALQAFLEQHPSFAPGSYCALGDSRDSSSLLTYYVGDVAEPGGLVQRPLREALTHDQPIVFVDDLVGRGSQSISIVENWLGVEPSQQLNERRTETLTPGQAEEFRKRQLAFVFVAGMDEGRGALEQKLKELGLSAVVYVHIPEKRLPFLENVPIDPDTLARFRGFCIEKGRELLADDDRTPAWIEDRTLGYGNRGLLLASTYNTPSATVTCLWKQGPDAPQSGWTAFLVRRKKR